MIEYTQFLMATEYQQARICQIEETDNHIGTPVEIENSFYKDVETLHEHFNLEKGTTIQMSLKEALRLLPRERKRSDAYRKLQKHLQSVYGVTLILIPKKNKV